MSKGYSKHNDYCKNCGHNKWDECDKDYCESIEDILCSESNISNVLEELLCEDIINWLETVPDVQTRINLLTSVVNTYSNRTCALGKLVYCSTELLKHCKHCNNTNCYKCDDRENCNLKNKYTCNLSRGDLDYEGEEKSDDNSEEKANKSSYTRKNKTPKQ